MNALNGALPDDWPTFGAQLEVIRLSQNFLNGEDLHSVNFGLQYIHPIPQEVKIAAFKGLPGLRVTDIRMNALKGPLPDDWSTLGGQLEVIRLSQNFLNGEGVNFGESSDVNFGVTLCETSASSRNPTALPGLRVQ
jgi:hypothetical protein